MTARRREGQPSRLAVAINLLNDQAACEMVDRVLGLAHEWHAPLMSYRLASDFQSDWKAEVGNVLCFAERQGFLEPLRDLLIKQANKPGFAADVPRDIDDRGHLKFHREVAPGTIAYYLGGTGWSLERWEPDELPGDVDLLMRGQAANRSRCRLRAQGGPQAQKTSCSSRSTMRVLSFASPNPP